MSSADSAQYAALMAAFEALCERPEVEQNAQLAALRRSAPTLADGVAELLGIDATPARLELMGSLAAQLGEPEPAATRAHQRLGPFALQGQLGVGGSGTVYRALDEAGAEIAVKLLHPAGLEDQRSVTRFRREFRAAARLDHPHCIRVLAEGICDGQRWFSMEYVRGGHLGDLEGAPLTVVLPLLIQVADALSYIHGQRIVHRDLKPSNVLLTDTRPPQVRLADFGIALDEQLMRLTQTAGVVGTLDYLSPEQVAGGAVDARSDLYSLGCVIWRLLTGQPAFDGPVLLRGVARVDAQPRSLRALRPDLPEALDALVQQLMAPEREARPQSALAVAHALMRVYTDLGAEPPTLSARTRGVAFHPGLAGRTTELDDAERHIRRAFGGDAEAPLVLWVEAPAGIGKTSYLTRLLTRLDAQPHVCFQAPGEVAPSDAIEHLAREVGAWRPPGTPWPPLPDDLWRAPTLGPQTDPGTVARRRVRRLADRLQRIRGERPVLLVLEDLHGFDAGANTALTALLDALADQPAPRPLVVATSRPHATPLERRADCVRLALPPLTLPEVAQLAGTMLGTHHAELTPSLAAHVFAVSGGNALRARTLVQSLIQSEALQLTPAGWRFRADAGQHRLLDDLRPRTVEVLSAAALLGEVFAFELLCALTECSDGAVLDALDEALRLDIVARATGQPGAATYTFTHDQFAERLAGQLTPARRISLHTRAGHLLAARGAPAGVVAAHLRHAADDAVARPALVAAGHAAAAQYQFARALDFYDAALARTDAVAPGEASALAERRAEVLVVIGRASEAVPLLERLVGEARTPDRRLTLWRKLGHARMRADDIIGGINSLERALRSAGVRLARTRLGRLWSILRDDLAATWRIWRKAPPAPSPRQQNFALVHARLAFAYRWLDPERAAEHTAAYRRAATRQGNAMLRLDAEVAYSMALSFAGLLRRGKRMQTQAWQRAKAEFGDTSVVLIDGVGGVAGMIELAQDDPREAVRRLSAAIGRATQAGDRFAQGMATAARGWAQLYNGQWAAGWADFTAAATLADTLGVSWLAADALAGLGYVHAYRGEYDAALRATAELDALGRRLHLEAYEGVAAEVRGWASFFDGRFMDAVHDLTHAQAFFAERHLERMWGYPVNLGLAEALVRARDHAGLSQAELLLRLDRLARFFRFKLVGVHMQRGFGTFVRGLAAARRGKLGRAERLFAKARRQRGDASTFWDAYMLARVAMERHHLGRPASATLPDAERAQAILAGMDVPGLGPLVRRVCTALTLPSQLKDERQTRR